MTEKHIPESRIAINPVVIDDSKRGLPPENNVPFDVEAQLAWLKVQALEAHNKTCTICLCRQLCTKLGFETCSDSKEERIYTRVIAHIENSRMTPHPQQHKLNVGGIPAVIEDCPYCVGSGKRMRPDDPRSRKAINPVVIDDSKRGNPPGWQEVEPEEEDPLKGWKAHPVKTRKDMKFIEETMR